MGEVAARAPESPPASTIMMRVARCALTTWLGLSLLVLVDAVVVALRGAAPLALDLGYAAYGALMAAAIALLGGGLLGSLAQLGAGLFPRLAPRRRELLSALCWGLCAGAVAYVVSRAWELGVDVYRLGPLTFAGSLLGVVLLRLTASRLPSRRFAGLTLGLALGLLAADLLVLRGLYLPLHNLVAFGAAVCAAHGVGSLLRGLGHGRPGRGLLALVAASALLLLAGDQRALRSLGSIHGATLPKLAALLRAMSDRDLDGHGAFSGDCDDTDPAVHPGACEIAGNQRDDNCNRHVDVEPVARASAPRGPAELRDVYLVVVDTLRADFGGKGRARVAPNFERFAAGALDFQRAYTPYPSTYRAMMAFATSRYHRYRSARVPPILSWLRAAGYDSQLWIDKRVLRDEAGKPPPVGPDRNVSDPFEVEGPDKMAWTAPMIDRALAELGGDAAAPPRARWIHLLDTHTPLLRGGEGQSRRARYEAEVAFVDAELGRLLSGLAADPRGARAAVVVIADHGEELGEHGGRFHGAMLWESSVRVPMLLRLAGVPPRRIDAPASLIDVLPTLAHHLGLPPLPGWQGHDWLASDLRGPRVVSQTEALDALASSGLPARVAVTDGRLKLIANVSEQLADVYDLERDPGELRNLGGTADLAGLAALERTLTLWDDQAECAAP